MKKSHTPSQMPNCRLPGVATDYGLDGVVGDADLLGVSPCNISCSGNKCSVAMSRFSISVNPGLGGLLPNGRDEAPHARIARREAMVIDQVLPDGHGVAPPVKRLDDQLTVGLTGARPRRSTGAVSGRGGNGRPGRGYRRGVGGHLRRNRRLRRRSARPATAPHRQASRLQGAAGGLAPDPGGLFDRRTIVRA